MFTLIITNCGTHGDNLWHENTFQLFRLYIYALVLCVTNKYITFPCRGVGGGGVLNLLMFRYKEFITTVVPL